MKFVKIFSVGLLTAGALAFGQGIKFEEGNFAALKAKAKKENKLIFMDAYTTWCGPCKLMAKNTFTQDKVGQFYNANFINSKIDMEKGEGVDIAKQYEVRAYPSYLFINGDGELIHRALGYFEADDFIQAGKDAIDPSKQLSVLVKKFEAGEKDPAFLMDLAMRTVYTDPALFQQISQRYFNTKKDKNYSREEIALLLGSVKSSEDPLYKVFVDNREAITQVIADANYSAIDRELQMNAVLNKAYNRETKQFNDALFLAELERFVPAAEAKQALLKAKMRVFGRDFAQYKPLALQYYDNAASFSAVELNEAAWRFFENADDKAALTKAVAWAHESVKKNANYANTDTLANLYNKLGDKKNARIWAEKSVALAKAAGDDYEDTQKLLDSLK